MNFYDTGIPDNWREFIVYENGIPFFEEYLLCTPEEEMHPDVKPWQFSRCCEYDTVSTSKYATCPICGKFVYGT